MGLKLGLSHCRKPEIAVLSEKSRPSVGPICLIFNGYKCYFMGVKRPRREADQAPVFSAGLERVKLCHYRSYSGQAVLNLYLCVREC